MHVTFFMSARKRNIYLLFNNWKWPDTDRHIRALVNSYVPLSRLPDTDQHDPDSIHICSIVFGLSIYMY